MQWCNTESIPALLCDIKVCDIISACDIWVVGRNRCGEKGYYLLKGQSDPTALYFKLHSISTGLFVFNLYPHLKVGGKGGLRNPFIVIWIIERSKSLMGVPLMEVTI